MKSFKNLKFVRLTEPSQFALIPRKLFEQVKGIRLIVDRVYQFGPGMMQSPTTFLYVLAEINTALIKGVLWATINPLTDMLNCCFLSVDKEYQSNEAVEETHKLMKSIVESFNLVGIEFVTTRPRAFIKKCGDCKQTKKAIIEVIERTE